MAIALLLAGCGVTDPDRIVRFASISAGDFHTCAVSTNASAYCWGNNIQGQLGDGSTDTRRFPVLVAGPIRFASVTAGGFFHTCGLTDGGDAYCWGGNVNGNLGDGSGLRHTTPVAVSGGHTFTTIVLGGDHTCGLASGGAAYCWGDNRFGQLGDGTLTKRFAPVAVSGALTFTSLAAAGSYTCGVTSEGAYCWGNNQSGQLGDGSLLQRVAPVAVSGGINFTSLAAGGGHTCALITTGRARCWGGNGSGQLGDSSLTGGRRHPVEVLGEISFASLTLAGSYSCGLTSDGTAHCWGSHPATSFRSLTPQKVPGGIAFTKLDAGFGHACGVTGDGTAYCWGANGHGQLGDNSTTEYSHVPVVVLKP